MNQNQREKRRKDRSCSTLKQMRTAKLSQIGLVTFLVTCETVERKNISFSQRIRPDGSRLFRRRGNLIERAWTTLRMRKVGSSRPWLFHIFQLRALIFPLLACVSQKTRKLLGPVDFSGLFSGEFLGSRKAFLNAPENTPDSHPSFSGCFLGFAARAW